MKASEVLREHIATMTVENEETIRNSASLLDPYDIEREPGDLAIRTCKCGIGIDGFYEYHDHLVKTLERAGL